MSNSFTYEIRDSKGNIEKVSSVRVPEPDFYLVLVNDTAQEVESMEEAKIIIQEMIDEGLAAAEDCTVYALNECDAYTVENTIKLVKGSVDKE